MPSITRCLQTPRKGRQASRGAYRMPANKYCRQTAWRQILTACLTCICPHWRGNISRKSVWGPAAKHRVTVGSLVACNRKMFTLFAGRAGPQLSVWFRHKCLPLWAPGIHAEHHCHRITQKTSSIVFCFAYPERTSFLQAIFWIWMRAEKPTFLGSWFTGSWELSLTTNLSMAQIMVNSPKILVELHNWRFNKPINRWTYA